ncbi:hypothetical protein EVAR_76361_1 [Eumeta japonica]|uniref:Uncharacterized protein n=1 Tax=Eumeta variegata TaxID=151549 RepID=A0A4C1T7L2_EUMVA|nr:hypothetical protein EVAR_76361_1 [Eumeta japonica]
MTQLAGAQGRLQRAPLPLQRERNIAATLNKLDLPRRRLTLKTSRSKTFKECFTDYHMILERNIEGAHPRALYDDQCGAVRPPVAARASGGDVTRRPRPKAPEPLTLPRAVADRAMGRSARIDPAALHTGLIK